jgi:dethiobiotin synthase
VAGLFITGTDTGIGKTRVTCELMRVLRRRGLSVLGMKPVATGCVRKNGELRNEDAMLLMGCASLQLPYELINPYAYEPATSPHIAAGLAGRPISLDDIVLRSRSLESKADMLLIEGIGGFEGGGSSARVSEPRPADPRCADQIGGKDRRVGCQPILREFSISGREHRDAQVAFAQPLPGLRAP